MVLILDKKTVLDCIDLHSLIDDIGQGMQALSAGTIEQPLRSRVFSGETGGLLATLPCYLSGEELFSAKIGFSHPTLRSPDGTRHLTQMIAFGDTEGRLLSIMHSTLLGMYRTAACSALAARYLTAPDADHLAVIGCGPMGRAEAELMATVRPLKRITVHDTNPAASAAFREAITASTNIEVEICASNEEAVKDAHIVSLATTAHDPVIRRDWLRPECHVAALGAHRKDQREVDSETVVAAAVFIEARDALMAEAGDYLIPLGEGLFAEDHYIAEIGALAAGKVADENWSARLTLFKSTGVGIQDLMIARHVFERATSQGLGVNMEF